MNKKIYLASPHMSDEGYEQEYVKEAFDTNWIAPLGENANKFEEELASYVGTKYAAALSAGTASLHPAGAGPVRGQARVAPDGRLPERELGGLSRLPVAWNL